MKRSRSSLVSAVLCAIGVASLALSLTTPSVGQSVGGQPLVQGWSANGSPVSGNPVLVGGSDGTSARTCNVTPGGNSGTLTSNGLVVAGSDGTNIQIPSVTPIAANLATTPNVLAMGGSDTGGTPKARMLSVIPAGSAAAAAAPVLLTGGTDGTNARATAVDSSGRAVVVGPQTNGSAYVGLGIRAMGGDGTNARDIPVIPGASAATLTGNAILMAGSDNTNARVLTVTPNAASLPTTPTALIIGGSDTGGTPAARLLSVVPAGSAASSTAATLMVGGRDGSGNAQMEATDTSGRQIVVGAAAAGAAAAGAPVLHGIKDGAANAQALRGDTAGVIYATKGVNYVTDTVTAFGPTNSNGTTAVVLGPAASGGKKVFAVKLFFYNVSTTVVHTVDIQSSGGTILGEFTLGAASSTAAGGNFVLDDEGGVQTVSGESLQFKIDSGGAATDVKASGGVVQKATNVQ